MRQLARIALILIAPGLAAAQPITPVADPPPELRASLVARHQVVLSSEVAARIAELPYRDGEAFEAGSPLVSFDCAAHRARLARATALRDRARAHAAAAQRLDRSGVNSRLEVETAMAEAAAAEAEVTLARLPVERCAVFAPFSGRVVELRIAPHQFVPEGTPLLEIIDHRQLEVEVVAPSAWLVWLRPGQRFLVSIDETRRDHAARIDRIGARIDPVSQTVKVYARLDEDAEDLLPGMSGVARLGGP
jgi:RND family efflux transporter MFP subunit